VGQPVVHAKIRLGGLARALAQIGRQHDSPQTPDSPAGLSGPAIGLLVGLNMAVIHTGKRVVTGAYFENGNNSCPVPVRR